MCVYIYIYIYIYTHTHTFVCCQIKGNHLQHSDKNLTRHSYTVKQLHEYTKILVQKENYSQKEKK